MSTVIDTLITDRTQADVDELLAAIKRCNAGTGTTADMTLVASTAHKGAYNYTDLNRVGNALIYVLNRLNTEAGAALNCTPKTNWTASNEPTQSQMAYLVEMVQAVRAAFAAAQSTPKAPTTMAGLTVAKANAIEKILVDADALITKMSATFRHCGVPSCGQTGGLMR